MGEIDVSAERPAPTRDVSVPLSAALERRAAATPDLPAVIVDGVGEATYGELYAGSQHAAAALYKLADGRSGRVGLVFGRRDWCRFALAYFACRLSGLGAVLAPPDLTAEEYAAIWRQACVRVVITATELVSQSTSVEVVHVDRLLTGDSPVRPYRCADPAMGDVIFTAGSTGQPKGVALPEDTLQIERKKLYVGRKSGVRLFHIFPPYSFTGTHVALYNSVARGLTVVIPEEVDGDSLASCWRRHLPRIGMFTPHTAQAMLGAGGDAVFPGAGLIALSGARSTPELLRQCARAFPKARIANVYGLTEGGRAAIHGVFGEGPEGALGLPRAGTSVAIVGPGGDELPIGTIGEIVLADSDRPPAQYYLGDVPATREVFGSGWVRTGDLGWKDDGGYVFLAGRKKDVIIRAGRNIAAEEVEVTLLAHACVAEAAVIGAPDEQFGEQIVAAVVLSGAAQPRELRQWVRRTLAAYKVPTAFLVLDRLPRNAVGKVRKDALQRLWAEERRGRNRRSEGTYMQEEGPK